jgi:hypothetical protein
VSAPLCHPAGRARAIVSWLGALGLLAALLGCGPEPAPGVEGRPSGPSAGAARPAAPGAPSEPERLVAECIERGVRGPGHDELNARDARRKLRRLQVKAECEAQLRR